MSDVSRAFQLCQNGAEAELASMLQSRSIDAAACQTTGMFSGWSLLHAAASKGHMRIVQMLLAAGAPASACNPKSLTPAQVAHEKGHTAVAALLQQAEASPGAALGAAAAVGKAFNLCLSGKDAELSKMLNEGAIAASACQTRGMYAGWSLLHAAAIKGHEHIVEVLLAFGASGKLTTPKGKTAAQLANDMGHSTLAELLIELLLFVERHLLLELMLEPRTLFLIELTTTIFTSSGSFSSPHSGAVSGAHRPTHRPCHLLGLPCILRCRPRPTQPRARHVAKVLAMEVHPVTRMRETALRVVARAAFAAAPVKACIRMDRYPDIY
jgi:hypothetical protein